MPRGTLVYEDCMDAHCIINACDEKFDTKQEALDHLKMTGHSVEVKMVATRIWRP